MSKTYEAARFHPELANLLTSKAPFACLTGAQASGKTIYSQYLERCFTRAEHDWSLGRLFALASHELELCQPEIVGHTSIGGMNQQEVAEGKVVFGDAKVAAERHRHRGYTHADGTTTIKHLKTSAARKVQSGQGRQQSLGVDFIDVPGEWASTFGSNGEDDELLRVLKKTSVFVLFVPFWSLIPLELVEANLSVQLDANGTTLSAILGGTSARGSNVRESYQKAHDHTRAWVSRLESVAAKRDIHVLVVLSQFQEDVVRNLVSVAVERGGMSPELSGWWDELDATLSTSNMPSHTDERVIAEFAERLSSCRASNMRMLAALSASQHESPTLTALNRLLAFSEVLVVDGAAAGRKRMRSVDVFPLNVVRLSEHEDLPDASQIGEVSPVPVDHRMCYDVLCWLLIQLHGEEVWPC